MNVQVISKTHVGMVRSNNEDALLIREPYLYAVADGMGGYAAGEIASRETLKAFEAATHVLRHENVDSPEQVLLHAFQRANEHIYLMANKNDTYQGMGTTLTAVYLADDNTAYAAHIGDSRLYIYRNGSLSQITHDHSYVAALLDKGEITESEAFKHPQKNMLLQAVGVEQTIDIEIIHFALENNDILLLCSDGLSDMLTDSEIEQILASGSLENDAESLVEAALANGGRDNISLILLHMAAENIDGEDN